MSIKNIKQKQCLRSCEKMKRRQGQDRARKDGSLGELWTCLREAASAKAGPILMTSNSSDPIALNSWAYCYGGLSNL
jgi:hypothetical protein